MRLRVTAGRALALLKNMFQSEGETKLSPTGPIRRDTGTCSAWAQRARRDDERFNHGADPAAARTMSRTMMKRRRCEHCDSGRGLNPTERGLVPASLPCFSSSVCASWTSPLFNSSFLYAPVSTSPRSGSEPRSIINERWKVSVVESSFLNFGLNSRWTPVCSVQPLMRFLWLIIIFLCGSLEDTPHCDAQYGGVAWTPAETFETWMLQVCGLCDACY